MNSYSYARDRFIALYRFDAGAQKLQLLGEVQSNSCRSHGIPDVWLSNSVFSEFFRLFESKSRSIGLSARSQLHFLSRSCDSKRKNVRFFPHCHHLFSLCLHITLSHSRHLRSSCYNFIQASVLIVRAETPSLGNKVSVLLCRITGFTKNHFPRSQS